MDTKNNYESNKNWCFDILEDVSRTFAVPINMIEKPRSEEVCVGYLICRISDTIEDEPNLDIEQKNSLFNLYKKAINSKKPSDVREFTDKAISCKPENPDEPKHWNLLTNAERLFSVYREFDEQKQKCIQNPALDMLEGMKKYCNKYQDGIRLQTIEELDDYCYYVAGTVGNMLTNITIEHNDIKCKDNLRHQAQKYGLLLQLVNIIKDVNEDYVCENNIYVPKDLTDDFGIKHTNLIENCNIDKGEKIINYLIEHAEENIPNARQYLKTLSKTKNANFRSWSIPYLLAVATLREMNKNASEVLTEGGVKITRDEVYSVINSVEKASYEEIMSLESKIYNKPLHKYNTN